MPPRFLPNTCVGLWAGILSLLFFFPLTYRESFAAFQLSQPTAESFPGIPLERRADIQFPVISRDGRRVALTSEGNLRLNRPCDPSFDPTPVPYKRSQVFIWDETAKRFINITEISCLDNQGTFFSDLAINGNGSRIAFVSNGDFGQNPDRNSELFLAVEVLQDIWVISQLTNTTGTIEFLGVSINDDGKRIAFCSDGDHSGVNVDGNVELFLWEEGVGITQLTLTVAPAMARFPSIDAVGDTIAFESNADLEPGVGNADANLEIFIWENGNFKQVTNIEDEEGSTDLASRLPSLSRNGRRVFFISNATGESDELFVRDPVNFGLEDFLPNEQLTIGGVSPIPPSVNNDGGLVAFTSSADLSGEEPELEGSANIYLLDASNIDPTIKKVTHNTETGEHTTDPSISGDGLKIAFVSQLDLLCENPCDNPPQCLQELYIAEQVAGIPGQDCPLLCDSPIDIAVGGFKEVTVECVEGDCQGAQVGHSSDEESAGMISIDASGGTCPEATFVITCNTEGSANVLYSLGDSKCCQRVECSPCEVTCLPGEDEQEDGIARIVVGEEGIVSVACELGGQGQCGIGIRARETGSPRILGQDTLRDPVPTEDVTGEGDCQADFTIVCEKVGTTTVTFTGSAGSSCRKTVKCLGSCFFVGECPFIVREILPDETIELDELDCDSDPPGACNVPSFTITGPDKDKITVFHPPSAPSPCFFEITAAEDFSTEAEITFTLEQEGVIQDECTVLVTKVEEPCMIFDCPEDDLLPMVPSQTKKVSLDCEGDCRDNFEVSGDDASNVIVTPVQNVPCEFDIKTKAAFSTSATVSFFDDDGFQCDIGVINPECTPLTLDVPLKKDGERINEDVFLLRRPVGDPVKALKLRSTRDTEVIVTVRCRGVLLPGVEVTCNSSYCLEPEFDENITDEDGEAHFFLNGTLSDETEVVFEALGVSSEPLKVIKFGAPSEDF